MGLETIWNLSGCRQNPFLNTGSLESSSAGEDRPQDHSQAMRKQEWIFVEKVCHLSGCRQNPFFNTGCSRGVQGKIGYKTIVRL